MITSHKPYRRPLDHSKGKWINIEFSNQKQKGKYLSKDRVDGREERYGYKAVGTVNISCIYRCEDIDFTHTECGDKPV